MYGRSLNQSHTLDGTCCIVHNATRAVSQHANALQRRDGDTVVLAQQLSHSDACTEPHATTDLTLPAQQTYNTNMPDSSRETGIFTTKPKRKRKQDLNWPPLTNNWPPLERGEIPRPHHIPESVSIVDLANYVAQYPDLFEDTVRMKFYNDIWLTELNQRLNGIVGRYYNAEPLSEKVHRDMAEDLTQQGGGHEFFLKFASNWYAWKMLALRYKTHHYSRQRAKGGKPRSSRTPDKRARVPNRTYYDYRESKDTNPGGQAASVVGGRTPPARLSQSQWCRACGLFVRAWPSPNNECCQLHHHDSFGKLLAPLERAGHISRSGHSNRTAIPSDLYAGRDSDDVGGRHESQYTTPRGQVHGISFEDDDDRDSSSDSDRPLLQRRHASNPASLSPSTSQTSHSLAHDIANADYDNESIIDCVATAGAELNGESDWDEDTATRGPRDVANLQAHTTASMENPSGKETQDLRAVFEMIKSQMDAIQAQMATQGVDTALATHDQRTKNSNHTVRRQHLPTTQSTRQKQRNVRGGAAIQAASAQAVHATDSSVETPTPARMTRNTGAQRRKSPGQSVGIRSKTRPATTTKGSSASLAVGAEQGPRTRSRRPLSKTDFPLPTRRS